MRTLAALIVAGLLTGCSSTVLAEPRLVVSPYYALYQLRGEVGMQSQPGSGPVQDNAPQNMRTFGQDHHRDDVGVRANFGDGFGGLCLDYYKLDMNTSKKGLLDADWGNLLDDDIVKMRAEMDELRVGWIEPVALIRSTWRDSPLTMRLGAGGVLAHRSMTLRATTEDGLRTQNAEIEGDVIYGAARFRAEWHDIAFDAEYAFSPEVVLSGDFEGPQQDLELRGSYSVPMRDVTFFAGYRYSKFPARGEASNFRYDADLQLDGFQLGLVVTF